MKADGSICAAVVTYNRKECLLECLDALMKQTHPVTAVCIIDNASTDATTQALKARGFIADALLETGDGTLESECAVARQAGAAVKIYYAKMPRNSGGAGGFHEAVRRSFGRGYDWLWLMDDDCRPEADCLEKLLEHADGKSVLGPFVVDEKGAAVWRAGLFDAPKAQTPSIAFNGYLVSHAIVEKVGYPIKEFFIYGDDVEYSLRIGSYGYKLFFIKDALLHHPSGQKNLKRTLVLFNKAILYHHESDGGKLYYVLRNNIFIIAVYARFDLFMILLRQALSYLIFGSHRFAYLKCLSKACRDAFRMKKELLRRDEYRIRH